MSQARHAFIWSRSGRIRDLHPAGQETIDSYANDINNKGQVVGLGNFPFHWSAATAFQPLAMFGNGATPTVINDAGIVGGSALVLDDVGDPMDLPTR